MSKTGKKRRAAPVQHSQISVRLLTAHNQVLVQVPSACSKQQTIKLIEEELSKKYPDKQYVKTGIQFPDGRFEADSQLASGCAFAQQKAVICFQPTAGEQLPLMDQITQHLQKQEERLKSQLDAQLLAQSHSYDAKLDTQAKKQNRINAFVCKPVLLRLASDILSLTLSAVKPDARKHDRSDIWSTPLQQHKDFAAALNRLCTKMNCPLDTSSMAAGFNKIRFDRSGMYEPHAHWLLHCSTVDDCSMGLRDVWLADELHGDHWMTLLRQAHEYSDLECDVLGMNWLN